MEKVLGFFGLGGKKSKRGKSKVTRETVVSRANGSEGAGGDARSSERRSRPVRRVEVTSPRLYVGNLSYDAKEDDLQEVFSGVGNVLSAEISINSRTQRSKGFGFVEMGSIDEARRAVEVLHDQELMGRKMLVSGAKPRPDEADQGEGDASGESGESSDD